MRSARLIFMGFDVLMLNIMLLYGKSWFGELPVRYNVQYYQLAVFMNITWFAISWIKNLYRHEYIASFEVFCRQTRHAYMYFVALTMLYLYFNRSIEISRLFMVVEYVAIAAGFFFVRLINLTLFHYILNKDFASKKVLIIGYNQTSKKLVQYLEQEPVNTEIIGFCEDEENVKELSNYPIVSKLRNIMNFCKSYGNVSEIYSTVSPEQNHYIYQLMQEADQACIRFKIIPDLNLYIKQPIHVKYFKDIPVLSVRKEPLDDITNRIKKRAFDLFISTGILLLILSWMIPLIGLLIWLEDRGPIFFIQKRSGKNNKDFNCIKFRSMRLNNGANLKQATIDDDRVTRIGRILRRTSLDEFPQFLNVFLGQMSLVGPRPHMLKHTDEYSKIVNEYMIRQFVKPGVTGWAQINGYRGEIKTTEDIMNRVQHDLWYLENWSLWLDTKIIFLTIYGVIRGDEHAF